MLFLLIINSEYRGSVLYVKRKGMGQMTYLVFIKDIGAEM